MRYDAVQPDTNGKGAFHRATIRDVAAKAGVSITTVSHFVSGREGACSTTTAERIRSAIAEVRYVPNATAKELGQKFSRTVGICLGNPVVEDFEDRGTYAHRVWKGVIKAADRNDYLLLHYPQSVRFGQSIDAFVNGKADGVIIASHQGDPRPSIIWDFGVPVVAVVQNSDIPAGIGAVYADESVTVDTALTHLWNIGHRRIAHITGPVEKFLMPNGWLTDPIDIAIWRRDAYVAWMKQRDAFLPQFVVDGHSWEGVDIPLAVRALYQLPDRPTAIFCANDVIALQTIEAASDLGWRVPDELSVVGVDNLDASASSSPALSTVEVAGEEIGEQAMELLLSLISGKPVPSLRVVVKGCRLMERDSTAPYGPGHTGQ